ncbi:MAG: DUF5103 domain-containing protein [Bacteroidaceae bacterium]|nr:DUF5103 domain-containing protein [Bacteroidaceae bacterium]
MKYHLCVVLALLAVSPLKAQQSRVCCEQIKSLQVVVDNDETLPPIVELGKRQVVSIDFDELSHDYHRYVYHVQHCEANWEESTEIFESDYLAGFNDQPIEEYENSFNTTQLYTHYHLEFPNENTRLLLSGNYRVQVFDDDDRDEPVLEAEFCVASPEMSVMVNVSSNTDIDFNDRHQQLSVALNYGSRKVVDPMRELHVVMMQNRSQHHRVVDAEPNIRKSTGLEWSHCKSLIFPAGNEFHKFELLDIHKPGLNVDKVRWLEPEYHTFIYPDRVARNYVTDEDQNGAFVLRTTDGDDDVEGEYTWVHFFLQCDERLEDDVFVNGQWAGAFPDESCKMEWDEAAGCYEACILLKQGYYNYQYLYADGTAVDGNFYQAENEYIVLVYHRAQGARYDALVAYAVVQSE